MDTRAVVLIRAGKLDQAVEQLREASDTDPTNASVPLHLAWARQNEGKKEEARQAFQKAVSLGWRAERSDPLERSFIEKLRQELGL